MKRICILALLLFTCACAWGQLNVKSKSAPVERLSTAISSRATLCQKAEYGIFMVVLSSNRFDKGAVFFLGEDRPSAVRTLSDLVGLCSLESDEVLTVEARPGHTCLIMPGKDGLRLKFQEHAGNCELRKKDLEAFIEKLSEFVLDN